MHSFIPSLRDDLRAGKGASSPLFNVLANRSSNKALDPSTEPVYKKVTLPSGEKIPRMHSYLIPTYLKLMKEREICQRDDGYRLYEKFPRQRAFYRGMWVYTGVVSAYTLYNLFFYMVENRP